MYMHTSHTHIHTNNIYSTRTHTHIQATRHTTPPHTHTLINMHIHGVCDILFSDSCLDWLAKLG